MTLLTYEYRLYPRKHERAALERMLEQGREVYNAALMHCKAGWEVHRQHMNGLSQWDYFREWRKQPGILLNASSLQHLLRRLDKAYSAFFRRLKAKETPGHPRHKGADQFKSLEYTYGDGCKLDYDEGRLVLYVQNAGRLKVKLHRPLPAGATVKHVVLKRRASGWYVYLMLEPKAQLDAPPNGLSAVGADMGLLRLLTLSDGTQIDNPRWLRHSLRNLKIAQRRLARRKKGSSGRKAARQIVARLHEHIASTRRDFWHKLTFQPVHSYGLIALEALNLSFMTRNPHLALSAHDAGLGAFQMLLGYKAANAGSQIVFVNPVNTSQACSRCDELVPKDLSEREHSCPHCLLQLDRDLNAALNILKLALKSARTESSGVNVDPLP